MLLDPHVEQCGSRGTWMVNDRMDRQSRIDLLFYTAFGTCIALSLVTLYVVGRAPIRAGELVDSDCYMHLIRVSELRETGRWYDPVILRSNAPFGDRLHWTRPFDTLLLAGAVPASFLADFDSSLFWWGVILSPVLLLGALLALRWAVRPLLGSDAASIVGVLFVMQVAVLGDFQAGRPDHHSLLLLLFLLSLGFALRLIQRPFGARLCYAAGAISALSVWASVESLAIVVLISAMLGALWILRDTESSPKALHYGIALSLFTGLALVIERPWHDWMTVEFDRLSIAHFGIFGMIAALWLGISLLATRTSLLLSRKARLLAGLLAACALAVAVRLVFPGFFRGPLVDVDSGIMQMYIAHIQEVQPLLHRSVRWNFGLPLIGYGAVALAWFLRDRRSAADPRWMFVLAAMFVYVGLSFYQVRWTSYSQTLLLLPAAALIVRVRRRPGATGLTLRQLTVNIGIMGGFLLLALSGSAIDRFTGKGESTDTRSSFSVKAMCEHLAAEQRWQGRPHRIVTHIFWSGEILYRTPHEIVGSCYHRNTRGILDTHATFSAQTDEQAREIIEKRRVDLILLDPESAERRLYCKEDSSTFYRRLCDGHVSEWCRRVELPADLGDFLLFEVTRE